MATATATCYRQVDGLIEPHDEWVICPKDYQGLCCFPGWECLDEQICHDPKYSTPDGSGYYIGLCMDATYKSSSCSSRCTDYEHGDVAYNSSTNLWACCGANEDCNDPTNETFLAPPPQQLLAAASSQSAIKVAAVSSHPATSVTSTSLSSATVTVTSTPSAMDDHIFSLDEGAKAGIGVGAALAAVAIIALLAWVTLLRKRLRNQGQAPYAASKRDGSIIAEGLPKQELPDAVRKHELSGYMRSYEMEGR